MIEKFKYNVDYTLKLYKPLDSYQLSTHDNVKELFSKYFEIEKECVDPSIISLIMNKIN